jgi:hypothetical protein
MINIIKNTNGSLWKINIITGTYSELAKEYNWAIYNYCPNIKYATVFLDVDGALEELAHIFIKCQHLEAIYIDGNILEKYCDNFLDLLIKSAPLTLYKIQTNKKPKDFNEESLKSFFINWNCRSKKTLHLHLHSYDKWHKFIEYHKIRVVEYDVLYYKYSYDDFWNNDITWPEIDKLGVMPSWYGGKWCINI